jgi:hypothetical protein
MIDCLIYLLHRVQEFKVMKEVEAEMKEAEAAQSKEERKTIVRSPAHSLCLQPCGPLLTLAFTTVGRSLCDH